MIAIAPEGDLHARYEPIARGKKQGSHEKNGNDHSVNENLRRLLLLLNGIWQGIHEENTHGKYKTFAAVFHMARVKKEKLEAPPSMLGILNFNVDASNIRLSPYAVLAITFGFAVLVLILNYMYAP